MQFSSKNDNLSADSGVAHLHELAVKVRFDCSACQMFSNYRDQRGVVYGLDRLLRQRQFGIAVGSENLDD